MEGYPTFDIREESGCESLAKHHIKSNRDDRLTYNEIVRGLQALVKFLGLLDWMVWRFGCFVVPAGHKHTRILGVAQAVSLGAALESVSVCEGFEELILGFNNPTQFDDTSFEAQMADWCLKQTAIKKLRFAPQYSVLGHQKKPDFEIHTPVGLIVCECKRLHINTHDFSLRLTLITNAFDEALKSENISTDLRLEVEVHSAIIGDLSHEVRRACREVSLASSGSAVRSGPFQLKLAPIGSNVGVRSWIALEGKVRVGDTPTEITPDCSYLLVCSPWMEKAIVRTVGALINSAHRQLPPDRPNIIFIDGPYDPGSQASVARLNHPEYAHCAAICFIKGSDAIFSRRLLDQEIIEWLFLSKMPPFGKRLRHMLFWRSGLRFELLRRRSKIG